jgi:hypothetical protein
MLCGDGYATGANEKGARTPSDFGAASQDPLGILECESNDTGGCALTGVAENARDRRRDKTKRGREDFALDTATLL